MFFLTTPPEWVTLWTIRKELGARYALLLAGRQSITALVSTLLLAVIVSI